VFFGFFLRLGDAVFVAFAVFEFEEVSGLQGGADAVALGEAERVGVAGGGPVGVTGRLPSAAVHRGSSRIRAGNCSRRRRR